MQVKVPSKEDLIIPTYKALLELGGSGTNEEITNTVIKMGSFSDEQVEAPQNGHPGMTRLEYELAWARTYLSKSNIIKRVGHCLWAITPEYMKETELDLPNIIKTAKGKAVEASTIALDSGDSCDGDAVDETIDQEWRGKLGDKIKAMDPFGFERLSMRLLRESGFDEVSVTRKTGDGGIDGFGILKLNDLFSIKVAFQCKRYGDTKITAEDIRQFRGTLPANIERGIFITTGQYTRTAIEEAKRPDVKNIDLINGDKFIDKLAEYEIGCKKIETYAIDDAYFDNI